MSFKRLANRWQPTLVKATPLGLTMLELLVALVLSVLVLGMLLPMFSQLMRPDNRALASEPAWTRAIAEDLRQIVSPAKSANSVVRVLAPDNTDPMGQLVLETFSHVGVGGVEGKGAERGPNEVRYRLEPVQFNGPFVLVRYAQGWHDASSSRLVIASGVTGWTLLSRSSPSASTSPSVASVGSALPTALHVELHQMGIVQAQNFWIPQIMVADSSDSVGGQRREGTGQ